MYSSPCLPIASVMDQIHPPCNPRKGLARRQKIRSSQDLLISQWQLTKGDLRITGRGTPDWSIMHSRSCTPAANSPRRFWALFAGHVIGAAARPVFDTVLVLPLDDRTILTF